MSYFPVKAVSVFLWGRRVGVIAGMQDGKCAFEYDPAFRRSGLEISPIAMPLSKALYSSDEFEVPRRSLHGVPGVFADSLPDSFGNRLVRKWMESRGIEAGAITPLDRLSYVGTRGMGALTYEPQAARADSLRASASAARQPARALFVRRPFRHRRGAWAGLRGTRGAVPPDGFQRVQPRDGRPYEELLLPDDG